MRKKIVHDIWGLRPGFIWPTWLIQMWAESQGDVLIGTLLKLSKACLTLGEFCRENLECIFEVLDRKSNIWKELQMEYWELGKKWKKNMDLNPWLWRCYQRKRFGFLRLCQSNGFLVGLKDNWWKQGREGAGRRVLNWKVQQA